MPSLLFGHADGELGKSGDLGSRWLSFELRANLQKEAVWVMRRMFDCERGNGCARIQLADAVGRLRGGLGARRTIVERERENIEDKIRRSGESFLLMKLHKAIHGAHQD